MIIDQFRLLDAACVRAQCEVAALKAQARSEALKARQSIDWSEMAAHRRRANVLAHKAMEIENNCKGKK